MQGVFGISSYQTLIDNGERMHCYSINGWTIDYSMTQAYASYENRMIAVHNDDYNGGFWIFINDQDVVEFRVIIDNEGPADNAYATVDIERLWKESDRPIYPNSIVISEGTYVASPMELAVVGLLTECAEQQPKAIGVLSETELVQAGNYYANYCNNGKASATRAAEAVESLLDEGKDIREIGVIDVLNRMSGGSYKFKLAEAEGMAISFAYGLEGSDNAVYFKVAYSSGHRTYDVPSEISMTGTYKNTSKPFSMVLKSAIDGFQYVVNAKYSSGNIEYDAGSFVLNERDFINYHIQLEGGDQNIDCAMIAQIYGALVWSSF